MRQNPRFRLLLIAVALATAGCLTADESPPSTREPTAAAPSEPTAGAPATHDLPALSIVQVEGTTGLLVRMRAEDEPRLAWFKDAASDEPAARVAAAPDFLAAAAVQDEPPRLLVESGGGWQTRGWTSEGEQDLASPVLAPPADSRFGARPLYFVGEGGDELVAYAIHTQSDYLGGTYVSLRSSTSGWTTTTLDERRVLRGGEMDEHGRLHVVTVGVDGTFYQTFDAMSGQRTPPERVLSPDSGWGIDLALGPSGQVAILAGEPHDLPLWAKPLSDGGARVALRSADGWSVQATGIAYRGSYADLRASPTLRLVLPAEGTTTNEMGVYAPASSGGSWRLLDTARGWGTNPFFLEGTEHLVVARGPEAEPSRWYDLQPVE